MSKKRIASEGAVVNVHALAGKSDGFVTHFGMQPLSPVGLASRTTGSGRWRLQHKARKPPSQYPSPVQMVRCKTTSSCRPQMARRKPAESFFSLVRHFEVASIADSRKLCAENKVLPSLQ
jgi:hypothetical protein